MRDLYKESDEKYIRPLNVKNNKDVRALASYKFHLTSITEGKPYFDKHDIPVIFKCTPDKLLNLCANVVDAMPIPSVYEWNIEDVCRWLRGYGYRQYQNTFRANFIKGQTLLLLNASALSSMNIKDFDHIKHITYGIRSLFYFEMTKFGRRLSLYPEFHNELYKLLRTKTGVKYENIRRSDLWRKMQLIRQKDPNYSHWELLERWLKFEKDPKYPELVGGIHRYSLYCCKANILPSMESHKYTPQHCYCTPPCECNWSETDRRSPWKLKCLPNSQLDKEFVEKCEGCIPPCTCRWTSKKYMTHEVLSCLQITFPQKYGTVQHSEAYTLHRLPLL